MPQSQGSKQQQTRRVLLRIQGYISLCGLVCLSGCGAFTGDRPATFASDRPTFAEGHLQRDKFRAEGDPRAIRWLLVNQVKQGMTRSEVEEALGQPGERVFNDGPYKRKDVRIRESDTTWRWGPDADGQVYLLFFRNDRLTNFDPADYLEDR